MIGFYRGTSSQGAACQKPPLDIVVFVDSHDSDIHGQGEIMNTLQGHLVRYTFIQFGLWIITRTRVHRLSHRLPGSAGSSCPLPLNILC